MRYKGVEGGTRTGVPLCRTCRNASYIRGQREGDEMLICSEVSFNLEKGTMPFEAYECSYYDDKRMPSKVDLYQTAWILRTDPKQKGVLGFVSPQQFKKEQKREGGPQSPVDPFDD